MIKTHLLTLTACAALVAGSVTRASAQDATPAPTAAVSAPATTKPAAPAADPEKEKFNAARKKAMEDPAIKSAMDSAHAAQVDAEKKMYEKMREIDPSLAEEIDKREARMQPKAAADKAAKPAPADKGAKKK